MSFSFLGYLHIEPISLTFAYVPVLVAGCILGAGESAAIGAVFGLASLWKASAFYVAAGDAVFSPMMSGKPLESFLLSVGTRTLFGFLIGLLYQAAEKGKHPLAGILVVSTVGRPLHTLLVYAGMGFFFPEMGYSIFSTLDDMKRLDFFPFILIVDGIVLLCYLFSRSRFLNQLLYRIQRVKGANLSIAHSGRSAVVMAVLIGLVFLSSVSVALYFTERMGNVMSSHGIEMSEEVLYDVMHLQIQFLLGMIALAAMVVIVIIMYQKNFNYLYYEARLDGLTGLLGRNQFFQNGERLLKTIKWDESGRTGCFIILDVDHFKEINDRYGHPEGDRVLREVAGNLQKVFSGKGILGRLGGDEFVVLVSEAMSRPEAETLLNSLRKGIRRIRVQEEAITCSIGVIPVEPECTIEELYRNADRLLYDAKKKEKDQFVFGSRLCELGWEKEPAVTDADETEENDGITE